MTKDEALTLALEALEARADIGIKSDKAITAIKEALAQPEQYTDIVSNGGLDPRNKFDAQPERPWVGLTDEDKDAIIRVTESDHYHDILMLAEAKLKEKNT